MDSARELEHLKSIPADKVCEYLAAKIRRIRQEIKESQQVFAQRAGISLRTYKRFECDGSAHLETFVRVLGALERTQYLALLFPQAEIPKKPTLMERIQEIGERRFSSGEGASPGGGSGHSDS